MEMIYKFRSIQWPVSIALTFTYTKLKTELIVTDFTKNQGALLINKILIKKVQTSESV